MSKGNAVRSAQAGKAPPEVISHLDAAIEILKTVHTLHSAGIDLGVRERTTLAPKIFGVKRSNKKR